MTTEIKFYPWSNGTQWMDWEGSNCDRCTKSKLNDDYWAEACPILNAIFMSQIDGEGLSEEMARRCGYVEHEGAYVWPCAEVKWTEEWKAEYRRRKGLADA